MRQIMRDIGYNPDTVPDMAAPEDRQLRLGAAKAFLERDQHTASLLRLHPALYAVSRKAGLVLSGHPVTQTNAFPYGGHALNSPGIMVFLPISPDLAIALHCPTIARLNARSEREYRSRTGSPRTPCSRGATIRRSH